MYSRLHFGAIFFLVHFCWTFFLQDDPLHFCLRLDPPFFFRLSPRYQTLTSLPLTSSKTFFDLPWLPLSRFCRFDRAMWNLEQKIGKTRILPTRNAENCTPRTAPISLKMFHACLFFCSLVMCHAIFVTMPFVWMNNFTFERLLLKIHLTVWLYFF